MNSANVKKPSNQEDNKINFYGTTEKLITIFHKAATTSGWYKKLLSAKACDASVIETFDDFFNFVPVLTKEDVFLTIAFTELLQSQLSTIHSFMLSSGHTGIFSIGVITNYEHQELSLRTDFFLENVFSIKKGEAIVINASSMGVRIFTSHTCCDTGPRPDIVIEMIRIISPLYHKTVVVADPYMVKQIAEGAVEAGIAIDRLPIWFISGGDWLPETLRKYVHCITGKSAGKPDMGYWSAIFGVTELGYPLFFETSELSVLRSSITEDGIKHLATSQMGKCTTPFIFNYTTDRLFVEQVKNQNGNHQLVFTVLDHERVIPMIRYTTGDIGEVLSAETSGADQGSMGKVIFWGRNENWLSVGKEKIFINDIRELLFADRDLATNITGYFTIEEDCGKAYLKVQLKKSRVISAEVKAKFLMRIEHYYPGSIILTFEAYHNFSQQMELDVERKFNHLTCKSHG